MKKLLKYLNPFSRTALLICAVCAAVHIALSLSPAFADLFNITVSRSVRFLLAKLCDPIPFSVGEFVLLFSPVLIFIVCRAVWKAASEGFLRAWRATVSIFLAASLVWCIFILDFSAGYRGTPLGDKLKLSTDPVSADELYLTANIISENINILCDEALYLPDGSSIMPFSTDELSRRLCAAYDSLSEKYAFTDSFKTRVKPLVISRYMTYTHISGVYSFFTGEANINTNYPDYICVFSAAHEMAHQRGVSREDEANFTAFLVCIGSDDAYIRYSAYMQMFDYIADALYTASPELYNKALSELSEKALGEFSAFSSFFDEYRDNPVADASDKINNAYLESQGTEGVKSYGMVVDLAVAYYRR